MAEKKKILYIVEAMGGGVFTYIVDLANAELKSLLPADEYSEARASTLNAFYTSPTVIKAMYEALSNMGLSKGNVLEPSCGVGNFMGLVPESIKSVAKQNNADARTLMRIYMMERFLERLAQSEYRDNFIIKGGILVTAMIGVAHRSTMDIDTSMKNLNLSAEDALRVVNQVKDIDLDDGVSFEVKDVSNIMDEMEYPGIRVTMNANVGRLITPLKIDISTGDVITPRAIEFNYDLLLEDRSISLWSYNLETILAEKLQTVLARGILNTRMRDFYDIRMLLDTYEDKVNKAVLKDAFAATCKKRGTDHLQEQAEEIIKIIEADEQLQVLWRAYQKKYSYAAEIDYASVISGVRKLMDWIR